MSHLLIAVTMASIFCLARAIEDFRAKRYWWAAAALIAAAVLLSAPVQTHSVIIDLPAP